jgi:hypothetical protein
MSMRRTSPVSVRSFAGLGSLVCAVVGGAVGCGGPAGTADASEGPLYSCTMETRAVRYEPNLTRTSESGAFQAILLESTPAPPARGSDAWTVKIVDADGAAQDGLTVVASPFMPDHGHPATVKAVVTPLGGGVYSMTPLYLYMPGYWEVTLTLQPPGGAKDRVMFPICIPG